MLGQGVSLKKCLFYYFTCIFAFLFFHGFVVVFVQFQSSPVCKFPMYTHQLSPVFHHLTEFLPRSCPLKADNAIQLSYSSFRFSVLCGYMEYSTRDSTLGSLGSWECVVSFSVHWVPRLFFFLILIIVLFLAVLLYYGSSTHAHSHFVLPCCTFSSLT